MVHALRKMQGVQFKKGVAHYPASFIVNHDEYDTEEEFLAIVVTNVYTSRAGRLQLRAGHRGHHVLQAPLDTSAGFLTEPTHNQLMNIYRLVWGDVFAPLSLIQAPFNPFGELARNLAHLGTAMRTVKFREPIYPDGHKPEKIWRGNRF